MTVTKTVSGTDWEKVQKELDYLNHHFVAIGFFGDRDDELLTIVGANEYGATIKPKNGNWLTLPTPNTPTGHDGAPMRVSEYEKTVGKLFRPKGKNVLCRTGKDGDLVVVYILKKQVKIPARPFIRRALAKNKKKYKRMVKQGIEDIMFNGKTGKDVLDEIGITAVADIQLSARDLKSPKNAPLTIENKKSSNPLVGRASGGAGMIKQVTHQIFRC